VILKTSESAHQNLSSEASLQKHYFRSFTSEALLQKHSSEASLQKHYFKALLQKLHFRSTTSEALFRSTLQLLITILIATLYEYY